MERIERITDIHIAVTLQALDNLNATEAIKNLVRTCYAQYEKDVIEDLDGCKQTSK